MALGFCLAKVEGQGSPQPLLVGKAALMLFGVEQLLSKSFLSRQAALFLVLRIEGAYLRVLLVVIYIWWLYEHPLHNIDYRAKRKPVFWILRSLAGVPTCLYLYLSSYDCFMQNVYSFQPYLSEEIRKNMFTQSSVKCIGTFTDFNY